MSSVTSTLSLLLRSQTTGDEAIERLERSLARVSDVAERTTRRTTTGAKQQGAAILQFAGSVRDGIQNPLVVAERAAEGFASRFGLVGGVIGGTTLVAGAAGVALLSLANSTQNLAEQQTNAANALGVSIRDYGVLAQAAENAGVSGDLLVRSFRGLSRAISDNSEEGQRGSRALRELGVTATDQFGALRNTRDLIVDVGEALGQLPNAAQRARAAEAIFGRVGIELLPVLNSNIRGTIQTLQDLGVGFDEAAAGKANRFGDAVDLLSTKLGVFKRNLGLAAIGVVEFLAPSLLDQPGREGETARRNAQARFDTALRADAERRQRVRDAEEFNRAQREGRTLSLTPEELSRGFGPRGPQGARLGVTETITSEQLLAQQEQSARTRIRRILSDARTAQDQLRAAQAELEDVSRGTDVAAVQRAQARVTAIEAQIKAQEKHKQTLQSIEQLEKRVAGEEAQRGVGIEALDRIQIEQQNFLQQTRLLPTELERVNAAFERLFKVEEAQQIDRITRSMAQLNLESRRIMDQTFQSSVDAGLKKLEEIRQKTTDGVRSVTQLRLETERTAAQQQAERDVRIIEARAAITPGAEISAINQIVALRIAAAEKTFDLERRRANLETDTFKRAEILIRARGDLEQAQFEAQSERELRLLDLQQRRLDSIRESAGQTFDAILRGGGGLRDFAAGQLQTIQRQIFQNTAVELFRNTSGRLTLPGQGTPESPNLLGRILQGTPFGLDPLKSATDLNTVATQQNTAALASLTTAARTGGGSVLGTVGGGLFGGVGTNGIATLLPGASKFISANALPSTRTPGFRLAELTTGIPLAPLAQRGGFGLTQGIGFAGALAGGTFGVLQGVNQGGLRGALTTVGSLGGVAASLPAIFTGLKAAAPFLGPLGLGLALGAPLISALLGDPKKKEAERIEALLQRQRFVEPTGFNYFTDLGGNLIDYDRRGSMRPLIIEQHFNIDAIDQKGFLEHRHEIAEATRQAVNEGSPLINTIQEAVTPAF